MFYDTLRHYIVLNVTTIVNAYLLHAILQHFSLLYKHQMLMNEHCSFVMQYI